MARAGIAGIVVAALVLTTPAALVVPAAAAPAVGPAPVTAVAPAPVTDLTAQPGDRSAVLTWAASSDPVDAYVVTVDGSPLPTTTTATSYTVTVDGAGSDLVNGTRYTLGVVARASGQDSAPVTVAVTPLAVPDPPTGLTATAGGQRVTLAWVAAGSGPVPTGYAVQYRRSGTTAWTAWTRTGAATSTTEEVSGLVGGTVYEFRVAGTNTLGTGPASAVVSATPWDAGQPSSLTATPADARVSLAWTAPTPDPEHPITGYAVQYRRAAATDWTDWTRTGGTQTTTETVTRLTNGTPYAFRVAALDDRPGPGPWSAVVVATPGRLPAVPTGLAATAGNSQVALTWSAPADTGDVPLNGYSVQYRASGTEEWSDWPRESRGTDALDTVTGLINDTTYAFRVAAVNAVGTGDFTDPVSAKPTLPPGPKGEPGPLCAAMFGKTTGKKIKTRAKQLMAGTVVLPPYGWFSIVNTPPSWALQPTIDVAGGRYINSLYWALPLLYRGVRYDPAMFTRYSGLVDAWYRDHRPKSRSNPWIDHPIYAGFRVMMYACAAQTYAATPLASDALRARTTKRMLVEAGRQLRRFSAGGNNTEIHSQLGAFAAYCVVGDQANADRAWGNLRTMAGRLIHADGSDTEGAPGYGAYAVEMLVRAHATAELCGLPGINPDALLTLIQPAGTFLAHASRPDFDMETIGDTKLKGIPVQAAGLTPAARWTYTKGKEGAHPKSTYESFTGGYVFARSRWAAEGEGRPTFYSVRTANGRGPHGHDDGQAVTFFADGVEWFADAGVGAYDGSSFRSYVIGRRAHSVAVAPGSARSTALVAAQSDGTVDRTCVSRPTTRVAHVRCVYYSRPGDFLLVTDVVRAASPKTKAQARRGPLLDQRWLLPSGISVGGSDRTWTLTSGSAAASVLLSGPGRVRRAGSGGYDGWLGQTYGQRTRGSLLQQKVRLTPGRWKGRKPGRPMVVAALVAGGAGATLALSRDAEGRTVATVTRPGREPQSLVTQRDIGLIGG